MDDTQPSASGARPTLSSVPNLADAVRRARVEAAERAQVAADLRNGEIARLDMLREAIRPIMSQVPEEVDLFDVGVAEGTRPRLFIDMIAFVEMARDRRTYRFLQDTRHGRITLLETDKVDQMSQAVADYVARRLVEREKALASDAASDAPAPAGVASAAPAQPPAVAAPAQGLRGALEAGLLFVIQFLGAATLTLIVAAALWQLWRLVTGADG